MNQYLYRLCPARIGMIAEGPTGEEAAAVSDHVDYLQSLTDRGVVLLFGRTQNRDAGTFGIVIFRAESDEAARAIMENDPAVKGRAMLAELFPYRIAGLNAVGW